MAVIRDEILRLTIVVNGDGPKKELYELEKLNRTLLDTQKALRSEKLKMERENKAETDDYKRLLEQIQQNNSALRSNAERMKQLREEIDITGLSINQLKKRAAELRQQLGSLDPGTDQFKNTKAEIDRLNDRIGELNGNAKKAGFSFGKLADDFNKYQSIAVTAIAATTGLVLGFRKLVDAYNQFEADVSELSSLTGLVGKDLDWLSEKAKELSITTLESGVRITYSANDIVKAYTLMGSAKPELLKNKEALNEVTIQAITLAQAAKMDLPEAVKSLAETMNQFGADASQAARVVNVLAAGSKEGAATVAEVNESVLKFGASAKSANVSIEQSVGLVEALAEKGVKGEIAGTGLKNVLLKLQTGANDTNPKLVGMTTALENLQKKGLSAADVVKMFGQENYSVAQILISNADSVKKYTDAVTATNVAVEQAVINTNNNAAALEQAKNKFQLTALEMGEKLAPVMTFSTNAFTYFLKAIMMAPEIFSNYGFAIGSVTALMIAYNFELIKATASTQLKTVATLYSTGVEKTKAILEEANIIRMGIQITLTQLLTGEITLATAATRIWNATISASPIMLVTGAIIALVGAIKLYEENSDRAISIQNQTNDANKNAEKVNKELASSTDMLAKSVSNLHLLNKESIRLTGEEIKKKIELAETELKLLVAQQARVKELAKEPAIWEKAWNYISSGGNLAVAASRNIVDAYGNADEAGKKFDKSISKISESLQSLKGLQEQYSSKVNAEKLGDAIAGDNIAQLNQKIDHYRTALQFATIGGEDYLRLKRKIAAEEAKLNSNGGDELTDKEKKALEKQAREKQKMEEKAKKDSLALLEKAKAEEQDIIQKNYINGVINHKQYQDQMYDLETSYLFARIAAKKQLNQEYLADELSLNQMLIKNMEDRLAQQKALDDKSKQDSVTALNQHFIDEQLTIDQNFVNGFITQQEYDSQTSELEYNKLVMMLEMKKQYGIDYSNEEKQLNDNNINLKKAEYQAQLQLEQSTWDLAFASIGIFKSVFKERSALGKAFFVAEKAMALAQVWINLQKELSIIAATYAAFPAAAIPFSIAAKVRAGVSAAVIATQTIQGFEYGYYPGSVYSNVDGKRYDRPLYKSTASTGVVNNPTVFLAGEKMPELIVDGKTFKNLQMNAPQVIDAIYQARNGSVDAYENGKYPTIFSNNTFFNPYESLLNKLSEQLEKGIETKFVQTDYEKFTNSIQQAETDFNP